MPSKSSVPVADAEVAMWIVHLASKIDTHAPVLAITQADIKTLKTDAAAVDWVSKALPAIRASAQQFTSFKDNLLDGQAGAAALVIPVLLTLPAAPAAVPAGVVSRTRALVQRIKKSPGYTEAIGKDLGIIGATETNDAAPKPTFKAVVQPSFGVRLDWVKGKHSGVTIQCKRAGDTDWVTLGRDNYSPYVDERPPVTPGASESRQYRMRYLDKDEEVGEWSDVVAVVAVG
jgi:hypothetical protein